jgi:hypothetical protein
VNCTVQYLDFRSDVNKNVLRGTVPFRKRLGL